MVMALTACATPTPPYQPTAEDFGSPPTDYQNKVNDYLDGVLLDPDSKRVKYLAELNQGTWLMTKGFKVIDTYGHFVCAEINAKNTYGGYAGSSLYFFGFKNDELVEVINEDEVYTNARVKCQCEQKTWYGLWCGK